MNALVGLVVVMTVALAIGVVVMALVDWLNGIGGDQS
jgi:hypothetical protein